MECLHHAHWLGRHCFALRRRRRRLAAAAVAQRSLPVSCDASCPTPGPERERASERAREREGDTASWPKTPSRGRRFAPIPIETTFERYTKGGGPAPELTPDPSPRSPSPTPPPPPPPPAAAPLPPPPPPPAVKEKRRFAPQLIDTSRRSRKAGDIGPATKPTDKTDITPHTHHIYAPKAKWRHNRHLTVQSQARRESCDDEIAGHVFDLIARDVERRLQEVALSAFPNSGARAGGAEHFVVRESSDDDNNNGSRARGRPGARPRGPRQSRRDSSEEDVGWAVREMQQHHDQLPKAKDRADSLDGDRMSLDSPSGVAFWGCQLRPGRVVGRPGRAAGAARGLPAAGAAADDRRDGARRRRRRRRRHRPSPRRRTPTTTTTPRGASRPTTTWPQPTPTGHPRRRPRRRPMPPGSAAGARSARPSAASATATWQPSASTTGCAPRRRPPMLGKDLTFRMCPSPQQTKLEPRPPRGPTAAASRRPTATGRASAVCGRATATRPG